MNRDSIRSAQAVGPKPQVEIPTSDLAVLPLQKRKGQLDLRRRLCCVTRAMWFLGEAARGCEIGPPSESRRQRAGRKGSPESTDVKAPHSKCSCNDDHRCDFFLDSECMRTSVKFGVETHLYDVLHAVE